MALISYATIEDADTRSAEMWAQVRGVGWQPGNVTRYKYGRRQRTGDPEADADLPAGVNAAIVIQERDADLDTLVLSDELELHEAGETAELYPAWELGGVYAVGDLVSYMASLYECRQAHTAVAENWTPPDVPALWLVYRKDADQLLEWVAGESVSVGTQRTYGGTTYTALQAHVTQADWTPDATPALWQSEAPPTVEWQPWTAYTIGDVVSYQGTQYQCRQSHTSQPGWEPPNVLALWLPI